MRLTPLRRPTHPASDTVRRLRPPRKEKRRAGAKAKAAFRVAAGWTKPYPTSIRQISSTQGVDLPCRPRSTPTNRHRETVEGGEVWVGRTVGAMDGAIEPPGVRALCLRSTASQAPERTAASGWAGLGFTACPANPHRPAQPAETQSRFGFGLAGQRPALPRVQGATLQRKRPPFGGLTFLYFSLISRRRSSRKPWAVIGSGYRLGFSGVMHEGSTSIRKSGFGCRKNGTE